MESSIAREQLRSLVDRIEHLTEERDSVNTDIREVYAEAKSVGFDTKVLRQVIALRKKDKASREEEDAVRDLYMHALGMLSNLPDGTDVEWNVSADKAGVALQ